MAKAIGRQQQTRQSYATPYAISLQRYQVRMFAKDGAVAYQNSSRTIAEARSVTVSRLPGANLAQ